ncbi:DUF6297 family protein [Rhodococcus daqingensis]|uniref:DUF6297 family protein n=1 Tax=Rhodococcus daqingensis TaxID=2479363 RepID=A0ABW2S0Y2_9NOCA
MALTTAPVPSAGTLRAMRRRFARAHAPGGDRAGTIVLAALGAYVVAGLVWWLTTRPATALADSAQLPGTDGWNPTWAWVVGAAAIAAGAAAAGAVGPLITSQEGGFWLLATPVGRAGMLRPILVVTFVVAATAGAAGGRLAAFAGAVAQWAPLTVGGAAVGVGVAATAVLTQSRVLPARTISVLQVLFSAVGIGGVVAAAAGLEIPVAATWTPVMVIAVITMALAAAALRACGRITAADLEEGADIAVSAGASIVGMDLSVLAGVVDDRAWRRIARRPTRPLPRGRTRALIRADFLRHLRRPSTFVVAAAAVAGAWTFGGMVSPTAGAWAQLAAAFVAATVFSAGLRELSSDPELAGMLGPDDRSLRLPLMVIPACAAAAVTVMTAPLVGWSAPALATTVIGSCCAAYRLRTRPRTTYDGLILVTGVGQLPIDLIRQKLRGPDILIATAILLAVAA